MGSTCGGLEKSGEEQQGGDERHQDEKTKDVVEGGFVGHDGVVSSTTSLSLFVMYTSV